MSSTNQEASIQVPQVPVSPTYNELYALFQQLNKQVRTLSECQRADDVSLRTSSDANSVAEFRIVPDLNKTVKEFNGRESAHEIEDWYEYVETLERLNNWPVGYSLQFVRSCLVGAARN
jgi:hypothetical protein